jgi:hypothetical protein
MRIPRIARRAAPSALLLAIALLLALVPSHGGVALAATPTAAPPTASPTPGARATPAANPAPAPSRRGATPQVPVPDRPGELAGVRYDPDQDTVGAGDKVLGYRDAQLQNGVPQADANRIALAHYKYDCQQTGNCDQTGLDLSAVDVNDAHANFGYHPECQVWGVDFIPWWGVWSPPEGQPNCSGSGSGGTSVAGAGFSLDPGALAARVLTALDWKGLLTALLKGLWETLVGDGVERIGGEIALFLVKNPNLLADYGGMGNVQDLVDAFRYAAMAACIVAFTITVMHFMAGREEGPQTAFGRLLAVLFALAFYRPLVGAILDGSSAIAAGVATAGTDATTGAFPAMLKALVPAAAPVWYLASLAGSLLIIAVGVVKFIGFAFLLLTYAAGPLLLPLAIHPRTAGWVGAWAEHLVKALCWPILWALEFRLFGALNGGLTLLGPGGELSLGTATANALTALAMLVLMAYTPWGLHTQFTVRQGAQVVVRQAGRAADAAAVAVTGGASLTARGAVASALAARRTGRSTSGN